MWGTNDYNKTWEDLSIVAEFYPKVTLPWFQKTSAEGCVYFVDQISLWSRNLLPSCLADNFNFNFRQAFRRRSQIEHRMSRMEIETAISWHYMTKISLAPKRSCASCESMKCLPQGRQSAFHLLFEVSRIKHVSEAPHVGRPVRVELCRDYAPVINFTPWGKRPWSTSCSLAWGG